MYRRSPVKFFLIALLLVLMIAFIWVIGVLLKDALPSNQKKNTSTASQTTLESVRGPFTLKRVNEDVGKTLYTYFQVYSRTGENGSDELTYVCGRRYESLKVKSIGWATDGSYDIVVQMTDGTSDVYSFDDNAGWN